MSVDKGFNTPNARDRNWTPAEVAAFDDIVPDEIVVIAYAPDVEQKYNHRSTLQAYAAARPATRFRIRPYDNNIMGRLVRDWVRYCIDVVAWFNLPNSSVIPANELNEAVEHGGSPTDPLVEDWDRQAEWLSSIIGVFQELAPGLDVEFPALAPVGNYQYGWAVYKRTEAHVNYATINAHVYNPDHIAALDNIPRTPFQAVVVTEFNQMLPETALNALEGKAISGNWFLVGGAPDQAIYDLLRQPVNYASLKNYQSGGEPPVSTDERDRYFRDLWKRFNVPFNEGSSIQKQAIKDIESGDFPGPPMEQEHPTENGAYVFQAFANRIYTYNRATGVVTVGLPPLS